jgi:hypothetical protein
VSIDHVDEELVGSLVVVVEIATIVRAGACRRSLEDYGMLFEFLDKSLEWRKIPTLSLMT